MGDECVVGAAGEAEEAVRGHGCGRRARQQANKSQKGHRIRCSMVRVEVTVTATATASARGACDDDRGGFPGSPKITALVASWLDRVRLWDGARAMPPDR